MRSKYAVFTLAVLISACATKRPTPVPVKQPTSQILMALPVCSMDTGASWLPDPCRMEVSKGEWLMVSTPKPEGVGHPEKPSKKKWWVGLLAALLI